MSSETLLAWHFVGDTLRDGRPVPEDGEWLEHEDELIVCVSGLHASIKLIDALKYAPGHTICRVECAGDIQHQDDKLVCSHRRILWRIDAEELLREFSRWCALRVIDLWEAPEVVKEYLETGDESLRAAARTAARTAAAARAAARAAAWAASWDAAWAAAWDSAADAAADAARAAARDAAWDATRDASWDAAWDSARAAAWDSAADAAAARSAAIDQYGIKLEFMVWAAWSKEYRAQNE